MTGREGRVVAGVSRDRFIARRGCGMDWHEVSWGRQRAMSGMGESKGQCGGRGSLEKIFKVYASGTLNREPLLVLEQGSEFTFPRSEATGIRQGKGDGEGGSKHGLKVGTGLTYNWVRHRVAGQQGMSGLGSVGRGSLDIRGA